MDQSGPLCILLVMVGVPLLVGLGLRGEYKSDFSRWAGYMTLKPFVATPLYVLWMAFLLSTFLSKTAYSASAHTAYLALPLALPGVLLTLWITRRYAGDSFRRRPYATWFLLFLDFARWGGSSWMTGLPSPLPLYGIFLAAGLPLVFALAALKLASNDDSHTAYDPYATPDHIESRHKSRKPKEDFVYANFSESIEDSLPEPESVKQWNTLRTVDGEVVEVVEDDPRLMKRKRG